MRRIEIVGVQGSGKSTLSRYLASKYRELFELPDGLILKNWLARENNGHFPATKYSYVKVLIKSILECNLLGVNVLTYIHKNNAYEWTINNLVTDDLYWKLYNRKIVDISCKYKFEFPPCWIYWSIKAFAVYNVLKTYNTDKKYLIHDEGFGQRISSLASMDIDRKDIFELVNISPKSDCIISLYTEPELRLKRLINRQKLSKKYVNKMEVIDNQEISYKSVDKVVMAYYENSVPILEINGSSSLKEQAKKVINFLKYRNKKY